MANAMADLAFHTLSDGRKVAFRHAAGRTPALIFLPGYMSNMTGSKATALMSWAQAQGRECLLLDYSGCGVSPGEFADGTLGRWRDEVCEVVRARIAGQVILIGSSMGGWLMVLVAASLGAKVTGLVGVAAAPDFTEWGYSPGETALLEQGQTVLRDNRYGPEPTPTHAGFWRDGQSRLLLDSTLPFDGPIRLLHGLDDTEVPYAVSLRLAGALRSPDVQVTLIKGGDHRLSRDSDIALLLNAVADLT
jgi:pimeloyl-ACP methyl ester carboxylesterase